MSTTTVDASLQSNARGLVRLFIADRDEAVNVPECGPLVAMLDGLIATCRAHLAEHDATLPELDAANRQHAEASGYLHTASMALSIGSTDRKEALRIRDDAEHARQCVTVWQRKREEARESAERPLRRVLEHKTVREQRARSEKAAQTLGETLLRGSLPNMATYEGQTEAEAVWNRYFEARELGDAYSKRAKAKQYEGAARPQAELVAAFEARRNARLAAIRKLEAEAARSLEKAASARVGL